MGEGESKAGGFPILSVWFLHPGDAHLLRRGEKQLLYLEEERSGVWVIKAFSLVGEDPGNLKCRCWGRAGRCGPRIQCAKSSNEPPAAASPAALPRAESGGESVGLGEERSIPHAERRAGTCPGRVSQLTSSADRVAREGPAFAGAGWDAGAQRPGSSAGPVGGSAGPVGGSSGCRGSDAAAAGDAVSRGDRHPPRGTGPRAAGVCCSKPAPRSARAGGTAAAAGDGFSRVGGRRVARGSPPPAAGAC